MYSVKNLSKSRRLIVKKKYYLYSALTGAIALSTGIAILSQGVVSSSPSLLHVSKAAAPTNQRRLWIIDNNGSSGSTSWWTGSTMYVYYWNASGSGTIKVSEEVLSDYYKGLWYVDITLTNVTTSLNLIVRVGNNDGPYDWGNNNQTFTQSLGALGTADTVWLNDGVTWDGGEGRNSRNASIGTTNGFSGAQLSVVMSKYNTCSSNTTNGYNAYSQMKTNFFDKTDSSAFSTKVYGQDVYTIQDYVDAMASRSGN